MQLSLIINQLKPLAPAFSGRVAGAAEYEALRDSTNLDMPSSFVVPLDDNAEKNQSLTGYRQTVQDSFGVIVILSNALDERGQSAYDQLDTIRSELWAALLGWKPNDDYCRVEYLGAALLMIDRYRMIYQFEFSAEIDINQAMTWQGSDIALSPNLTQIHVDLDHKDLPPDGEIDHTLDIPIDQ